MKIIRRLYDWVLTWAHSPYGAWALFIVAFVESSFFPIPPDVLLITLAISLPAKAFRYALICSVGSVLGGIFGYLIGLYFMEAVGYKVLAAYGITEKFEYVGGLYRAYDAWAVAIAGFTPIPYKLFTIAAGAFRIDFNIFVLASIVSRSARFFLVAALIYKYGGPVKAYIDKYFNILTIVFTVLLIAGFIALKYLLH